MEKPNPLPEMLKKVEQERGHIPRYPKETQRILLSAYQNARMNSLGKKAVFPNNHSEVMKECLNSLAKDYPDVAFLYDKGFFGDCG